MYTGNAYTVSSCVTTSASSIGSTGWTNVKYYNNNNNKSMKESSKELYTLTFLETKTIEVVFEVIAESVSKAKELVAKGWSPKSEKTLQIDTDIVSITDAFGEDVSDEEDDEDECKCE